MSSDKVPPASTAAQKITPSDVAAATAVGAASRLGAARHKAKVAEGAAAGSAGSRRARAGRSNVVTAIGVAVVMIGTLALMVFLSR